MDYLKNYYNDCVDCKRCMDKCPMMNKFIKSPKDMLKNFYEHSIVDNEMTYSCMFCGECSRACKRGIDISKIFRDKREKNILNKVKVKGLNIGRTHQKNSFSKVFSKSIIKENSSVAFFPGCSLSSYNEDLLENIYIYLNENIRDVSIIFNCCAKPTYDMGDREGFKRYITSLNDELNKNNIKEVIVACENCYKTIRENSNIKVTSLYEIIGEYGLDNTLKSTLKNAYSNLDISFALHDPCPIRNEKIIHEAVRKILNQIGIEFLEFKNNRENTECCGFGGMVYLTNKNVSEAQMRKRASSTDADCIISYCESCVEAMILSNKKSIHLLDLVFRSNETITNCFTQKLNGTIKKWIIRKKAIIRFDK